MLIACWDRKHNPSYGSLTFRVAPHFIARKGAKTFLRISSPIFFHLASLELWIPTIDLNISEHQIETSTINKWLWIFTVSIFCYLIYSLRFYAQGNLLPVCVGMYVTVVAKVGWEFRWKYSRKRNGNIWEDGEISVPIEIRLDCARK